MEEQIEQIAQRLKGMRDAMDISLDDAARTCEISKSEYMILESGRVDIPVSILHRMAQNYQIELSTILCGEEPHMQSFSLTRSGQGAKISRRNAYEYHALANSFINRNAEPFEVSVEPNNEKPKFSTHAGQELSYVIEGKLQIFLNDKDFVLEKGDSLYFDSSIPHAMKALDGNTAKFLAVIL